MTIRYIKNLAFKLSSPKFLRLLASCYYRANLILGKLLSRNSSSFAVKLRITSSRFRRTDIEHAYNHGMGDLARWGEAIQFYESVSNKKTIRCSWTALPYKGNFGDWLAPYLISKITDQPIKYLHLRDQRLEPHFLSVGSILASANKLSIVLGSGFNSQTDRIGDASNYVSVRGLLSQDKILEVDQKPIFQPCDPGFFMPFRYSPPSKAMRSDLAFVPHVNHVDEWTSLKGPIETILPYARTPAEIELLIEQLHGFQKIVTTAMHIFIVCFAYGIPVSLVRPANFKAIVPGDGFKYLDMSSVITGGSFAPEPISLSNSKASFDRLTFRDNSQMAYFRSRYSEIRDYLDLESDRD